MTVPDSTLLNLWNTIGNASIKTCQYSMDSSMCAASVSDTVFDAFECTFFKCTEVFKSTETSYR